MHQGLAYLFKSPQPGLGPSTSLITHYSSDVMHPKLPRLRMFSCPRDRAPTPATTEYAGNNDNVLDRNRSSTSLNVPLLSRAPPRILRGLRVRRRTHASIPATLVDIHETNLTSTSGSQELGRVDQHSWFNPSIAAPAF